VGELMLASATKLRAPARLPDLPDNTIHQGLPHVEPRSPLPWLHIAEVVAREAAARKFRTLGLLGTRWLIDGDVYPAKLAARDLKWLRPSAAERDESSRIIMES
jgi:aspartate racemase